jgi:flagellar protein FlaI
MSEILDPKAMESIKERFEMKASEVIAKEFPNLPQEQKDFLVGTLLHEMLGLGRIEIMLEDPELEEIVINSSAEPAWVYHKKHGWLKTNIMVPSEAQIYNYASIIGRKVGRQITNLTPLMDAHLLTGDRVNSTLFPISSRGNTITIRKFAREPWTIIHFIDPKANTLSKEVASLMWLCIEYELNILIAGGTASGKTSLLNAIMAFMPPNQRIISIEDTRELLLPDFLHWIPLTTRQPNPEGKGEITMLDLVINSLRMRPDRVILGEIRRQKEAEVLFEAMHTGHSVYSTVHADRVEQVKRRLTTPPISVAEELLEALHLVVVQFRHRRKNIRRTFEVAEVIPVTSPEGGTGISTGLLYRWNPKTDKLEKSWKSVRLFDEVKMHTGMSDKEISEDILQKENILQWMLDNKINTVNTVGKIIAEYYNDKNRVIDAARTNKKPSALLGEKLLEELKK